MDSNKVDSEETKPQAPLAKDEKKPASEHHSEKPSPTGFQPARLSDPCEGGQIRSR